jgi:hypothetical protein
MTVLSDLIRKVGITPVPLKKKTKKQKIRDAMLDMHNRSDRKRRLKQSDGYRIKKAEQMLVDDRGLEQPRAKTDRFNELKNPHPMVKIPKKFSERERIQELYRRNI